MKYIKLYENRRDFVFDEQRYFPNTALVNGEDEPSYFTDVEEVVFELTVTLPTEKVVTGQTYTLAVEYGGADVFSEATVTTTGDVTLNGTQFTANTDGDFSVTATYDDKTVTLNGTSKLMTATPTIAHTYNSYGTHNITVSGAGTKTITINGVEYTSDNSSYTKTYYEDLTAQTVAVTVTAQETGKWATDTVSDEYTIPAAQTLTATISDDTLDDGDTAQITVMYGSVNATAAAETNYTASGDVTCTSAGVVTAAYSTGSGSIVVRLNNLTPITINVTVAQPQVATNIVFADSDVKTILANAFGSNGEITEEQAAAVTTWFEGGYNNTKNNPFCKNSYVDSFTEFGTYFTSVTEIGVDAFQDCYNMQSITLPSSLTYIPDYAFSGCSSLESVTIPAAVTYIGYRAFNGCSSLENITIPADVTYIGTQAFNNCTSLESFTLNAELESWGARIFNNCTYLAYMSVNAGNSYFNDGNGSNVINLRRVNENFDNLLYGGGACYAIPNTVKYIGDNAFSGRYFLNDTLTIPASVEIIDNYAFSTNSGLTRIIVEATTPPSLGLYNTTLSEVDIYVPAASLDLYKAESNWSDFASRIRAYLTVSLSSENIVTGETYTLSVSYCGVNVLSNATVTATGDVTISGSSFTANSDGAFSITATYNGYTATLNGTASAPVPAPEYSTAVLDCSHLEDADPLESCFNGYYDEELEEDVVYQEPRIDCAFSGNVAVENGVITMSDDSMFDMFEIGDNVESIGYVKLTHPSAEYKVDTRYVEFNGAYDYEAISVTFDSATLTTTISNFVPPEGIDIPFDGSDFSMNFNSYGENPIKITQIEVGYVPAS